MSFQMNENFLADRTATADLSAATKLYTPVTSTSNTTFKSMTTKGGVVLGVLMDSPSSGRVGLIQVAGITKLRVVAGTHTAIAIGDRMIASTSAGFRASTNTTVTHYTFARALETLAANTTGIISALITHEGSGSTGAQSGA